MKITRRQLRQIILEAADTPEAGTTGARRTRDGDQALVQRAARTLVQNALDAVNHETALKGTAKIGRTFINVKLDQVTSGDARDVQKLIKKAIKDNMSSVQVGDGDLQDALKAFRRVKVDFMWDGKAAEVEEPEVEEQEPDPKPDECHDGKLYDYDRSYDYRVNRCTGCWEAKKKSGGSWFSMKRYKPNMAKLDRKFDDARDKMLRDNCPAVVEDQEVPKPEPEPVPVPEPSPVTKQQHAIIVLMAHGTDGVNGQMLLAAYNQGKGGEPKGYDEVISQGKRLGMTLPKAITYLSTPGDGLDLNGVMSKQVYNNARNQNGMIGAMALALNQGAEWDLPYIDAAYSDELVSDLKVALGQRGGVNINETKYGESRGTLLRKRYYGRY